MAIFEKEFTIAVKNVGAGNLLTNSGIIQLFEEAACSHSEIAGFGLNQIEQTHLSWVLLHWKVRVFKRPIYSSTVIIKTWARNASRCTTHRDFEMVDENGELLCIASSKWSLVSTDTGSITKITPEIINCYSPELEKSVFGEDEIPKLKEPEVLAQDNVMPNYTFTVQRRDIDVNNHMHNLYYLDYAIEALPQEVYSNWNCNEFEIMYKSGAKLGDNVNCFYAEQDDAHFVVMKNAEDGKLNAIIKLCC